MARSMAWLSRMKFRFPEPATLAAKFPRRRFLIRFGASQQRGGHIADQSRGTDLQIAGEFLAELDGLIDSHLFRDGHGDGHNAWRIGEESGEVLPEQGQRAGEIRIEIPRSLQRAEKMAGGGRVPDDHVETLRRFRPDSLGGQLTHAATRRRFPSAQEPLRRGFCRRGWRAPLRRAARTRPPVSPCSATTSRESIWIDEQIRGGLRVRLLQTFQRNGEGKFRDGMRGDHQDAAPAPGMPEREARLSVVLPTPPLPQKMVTARTIQRACARNQRSKKFPGMFFTWRTFPRIRMR